MDNVAAALYVTEMMPKAKKIAGINQNYAWGQDSWNDFEASMKVLKPDVAGDHLADAQAARRPVRRRDLGAHGRQPRRHPLQLLGWRPRRLRAPGRAPRRAQEEHRRADLRRDRHAQAGRADPRRHHHRRPRPARRLRPGQRAEPLVPHRLPGPLRRSPPTTPPTTWPRPSSGSRRPTRRPRAPARAAPTQDQVIAAFEGLTFETPSGTIKMALGKGHQAVEATVYGSAKTVGASSPS